MFCNGLQSRKINVFKNDGVLFKLITPFMFWVIYKGIYIQLHSTQLFF